MTRSAHLRFVFGIVLFFKEKVLIASALSGGGPGHTPNEEVKQAVKSAGNSRKAVEKKLKK